MTKKRAKKKAEAKRIEIKFKKDDGLDLDWSDDVSQEDMEKAAVFLLRTCADDSSDGIEKCLERLWQDAIQFHKDHTLTT